MFKSNDIRNFFSAGSSSKKATSALSKAKKDLEPRTPPRKNSGSPIRENNQEKVKERRRIDSDDDSADDFQNRKQPAKEVKEKSSKRTKAAAATKGNINHEKFPKRPSKSELVVSGDEKYGDESLPVDNPDENRRKHVSFKPSTAAAAAAAEKQKNKKEHKKEHKGKGDDKADDVEHRLKNKKNEKKREEGIEIKNHHVMKGKSRKDAEKSSEEKYKVVERQIPIDPHHHRSRHHVVRPPQNYVAEKKKSHHRKDDDRVGEGDNDRKEDKERRKNQREITNYEDLEREKRKENDKDDVIKSPRKKKARADVVQPSASDVVDEPPECSTRMDCKKEKGGRRRQRKSSTENNDNERQVDEERKDNKSSHNKKQDQTGAGEKEQQKEGKTNNNQKRTVVDPSDFFGESNSKSKTEKNQGNAEGKKRKSLKTKDEEALDSTTFNNLLESCDQQNESPSIPSQTPVSSSIPPPKSFTPEKAGKQKDRASSSASKLSSSSFTSPTKRVDEDRSNKDIKAKAKKNPDDDDKGDGEGASPLKKNRQSAGKDDTVVMSTINEGKEKATTGGSSVEQKKKKSTTKHQKNDNKQTKQECSSINKKKVVAAAAAAIDIDEDSNLGPLSQQQQPEKQPPSAGKPVAGRGGRRQEEVPPKLKKSKLTELRDDEEATTSKGGGSSHNKSFQSFLHRGGPINKGSKPLPKGSDDCLSGLKFVITGVLDSLERDEAADLIKRHGGAVTGAPSSKTSYLLAGREAGESKLKKAKTLGIKEIDEDGLFELIISRSPKSPLKKSSPGQKTVKKSDEPNAPSPPKRRPEISQNKAKEVKSLDEPKPQSAILPQQKSSGDSLPWVDKYKPTSIGQILGQQGDKSCVKKLLHWLRNWDRHNAGPKQKGSRPAWNAQDGSDKRAVLLSGPPGIGKTTSAHLCAKELGLIALEMNASDVRKQSLLKDMIAPKVSNRSIDSFTEQQGSSSSKQGTSGGTNNNSNHNNNKQVLIMDEVDGMSGNEDRAGMSELLQIIKTAKYPIICICNDRQNQKIRSLSNYCFDLRFYKPRTDNIKSRVMTIACREGIKLNPQACEQLIEGANNDIRQVIQHLQLLGTNSSGLDFDSAKSAATKAKKDLAVNIFEAGRDMMNGPSGNKPYWISEKTELFFLDYSLMPLFVQENYLKLNMKNSSSPVDDLKRMSEAADCIAAADRASAVIGSTQNWSLLNAQCMLGAVLPTGVMNGYLSSMLSFPSWLGKNSNRNKNKRLVAQLNTHMSTKMTGDHESLILDYVPHLRTGLSEPLVQQEAAGAKQVAELMGEYALIRDDVDSIMELGQFSGFPDPMSTVAPKTKAALTRLLNSQGALLPYSNDPVIKKKRKPAAANDNGQEEGEGEEGDEASEVEEDFDPNAFKKAPSKKKAPATKTTTKTGTGKGGKGGKKS